MLETIYYQPIMTDAQWNENKWFNSRDVYYSLSNAKKDFPNCEIGAYSGDDIEEPTFLDIEDLKEKHEEIRSILIDHGNEEHGDCIIDEICEAIGIPPTTIYYVDGE
jgi:hypothetical protein